MHNLTNCKKYKKIDYHNKNFKNPFFRKKRKIRIRKIRLSGSKKIILILFLLLAILLIWFFYFSPIFNIKNIEINGLSKISNEEIEKSLWLQTKSHRFVLGFQKNLFLFDKDEFTKNLNEKYYFEKLIVEKKFFKKIIIEIQEKSNAFIWGESEKYYYCDKDGYIISQINLLDIKEKKYPFIYNNGENKISDDEYKKIGIENKYIDYIINLFDNFKNISNDFKIEKFIIDDEVNTVKILILDGPSIYFNIEDDIIKQIDKLLVIKNEKLKNDFNSKEYIDLRYGDKIYYR